MTTVVLMLGGIAMVGAVYLVEPAALRGVSEALMLEFRVIIVGGLLWSTAALAARRVRHIGLEPLLVLPTVVAGELLLKAGLQGGVPDTLANAFGLAWVLWLLLWPGAKSEAAPPRAAAVAA